jgi:hypothetical protein
VSVAPTNEHFAGTFKATPVKQLSQSSGRRRSALTSERRESRENGLALIEVNVRDLAAVATVPAKRSPPEPFRRFRVKEENELEGFCQPNVLKLCCRREGFSEVPACVGEMVIRTRSASAPRGLC